MAAPSSPPLSRSPRQSAALQPKASKSDTNLAGSIFAADSAVRPGSHADGPSVVAAAAAAAAGGQHAPLIPSYPYNLSMSAPFIPGCSSSDPRLFEQHAPDDSSVQTRLPSIAVDYLSHDWKEDDVWASWKAMTKHKSELANGVRLENASWRTWAKQRGKLKTISPETLNWLKDSDVTWLYGPLHTAVDPVPPPRESTTAERLGLSGTTTRKADKTSARSYSTSSSTPSGQHGVPLTVKPILKHRSLSDILSVPNSGAASPAGDGAQTSSDDEGNAEVLSTTSNSSHSSAEGQPHRERNTSPAGNAARRPGILRTTSSDSANPRKTNVHPHGFDSDAVGTGQSPDIPFYPPSPHDLPSSTRSSFPRISSQDHFQPKKRHIVFNHRVEQCISLDAEEVQANLVSGSRPGKQPYSNALQRYGSHQASSTSSSSSASSTDDEDDEEDDEDAVLTFRSSSPKSPSFMKPFLPSPTGSGLGSGPHGQGGKQVNFGNQSPHGQQAQEPHTIAPLEPTTLKDSELMPGPTPIVVYQDGKITAFYGTEEDYVYDADEHGGIPHWAPRSAAELGGTAIADDEEEEDVKGSNANIKSEHVDDEGVEESHYDDTPASSGHANVAQRIVAMPPTAKSMMQNNPVTSSARYATEGNYVVAGVDGQITEPNSDQSTNLGSFAGPESAVQDDYDTRQLTASQAQFGNSSTPQPAPHSIHSQPLSNTSSTSSSEVNLSGTSPGAANSMLYSSSPSGLSKTPTKSILKKGRDPLQPGSADYYPPVPPAVTRASRAHAQMFDENGDEVVSPQRAPIRLPETATLAQDGSSSPSLVLDSSSSQALSSAPYGSSLGLYGTSATSPSSGQQEPSRGRSISRGNSSSSLYERAQSAAAAADYRSRSQSGGSSISPVASYSPPFTASLNSLGAGTAVMQSQPAEAPRGRNVQTARPSTRREALSDTSSDEEDDSSTDTEGGDDEGQAAGMDFSEDATQADNAANSDSVHFARQHGPSHSHASMKQSHNATLNDDDDAEVEQVSSPEGMRGTSVESGFDSRPVNAASAGREKASLPSHSARKGRQADAALPVSGNNNSPGSGLKEVSESSRDMEDGDLSKDSDAEDHLFDSPYMPSSPRITSSSNLAGIRSSSASEAIGQDQSDPYTLSWADKEDRKSHTLPGSRTKSLARAPHHRPSWLGKRGQPEFDTEHSVQSEDELSDPANNGYSYGYGFDDEDDGEQEKGYVGKATELIGALWNVGTGMVWGRPTNSEEARPGSSAKRPAERTSR